MGKGVNSRFVLIFLGSFVIVLSLFVVAHANTELPSNEGPYDCMHILLRAAKSTMKALTNCSKIVKESTSSAKEYADKLPCIMKCAMEVIGLLKQDGDLDNNGIKKMMEKYVPNDTMLKEVKIAVLDSCKDIAGRLDSKEETCKSYGEYVLCLQMAVEEYKDTSPWCIKKPKKNQERKK